jgi:hypothetical protein
MPAIQIPEESQQECNQKILFHQNIRDVEQELKHNALVLESKVETLDTSSTDSTTEVAVDSEVGTEQNPDEITESTEKPISEPHKKSIRNRRKQQQLLEIHSSTLDCSEYSSDFFDSSSDDEDDSEEDHIIENGIFLDKAATLNIYFDSASLKAKLNTAFPEHRDISQYVLEKYHEWCAVSHSLVCTLDTVLTGLELPEDATHLLVSFVNYHGDRFQIPFSLNHRDDPFPFSDPELIVNGDHDEDLPTSIVLIERPVKEAEKVIDTNDTDFTNNNTTPEVLSPKSRDKGDPQNNSKEQEETVTKNATEAMLYFSRDNFTSGFRHFRPYAWDWLKELSQDPEAILLATRKEEACTFYTSISLYHPELFHWSECHNQFF